MLYDTHAHINLAAFADDYKDVLQQQQGAEVFVNNVGTHKDNSQRAVELVEQFPNVFAVVGLHPGHTIPHPHDEQEGLVDQETSFDYQWYKALAAHPKVVGIGECGLDYFRIPEGMTLDDVRALQMPVFIDQVKLAHELNKTLVIHCRASKDSDDAYQDILKILGEHKDQNTLPRFEVHSFTATMEIAQAFLDLGGYIGLNAIITFDKSGVLEQVTRECPLERIVLETDAPYLAPAPYRGKRNIPAYVQYVAEYVARIKGIPLEQVASMTTENARKLFSV